MDATLLARTMIVHFHAVLKTPLTDTARAIVLQLLAQAEAELARARAAQPPAGTQRASSDA